MKKKFGVVFSVILATAMLLSGCGDQTAQEAGQSTQGGGASAQEGGTSVQDGGASSNQGGSENGYESGAGDTDKAGTDNGTEVEGSKQEKEQNRSPREIYEAFMKGEEPVYVTGGKWTAFDMRREYDESSYVDVLEEGKAYTIREMMDAYCDIAQIKGNASCFESVQYSYIDCGKDGKEELFMTWTSNSNSYDSEITKMIFQVKDNQLYLCYADEEGYRCYLDIRPCGLILNSTSYSYSLSECTRGYIDADGQYQFLFCETNSYGADLFYGSPEYDQLMEVLGDDMYDVEFDLVCFVPYSETTETKNSDHYVTVYVDTDEMRENIEGILTDAGYNCLDQDAMHEMTTEKMAAVGITEEDLWNDVEMQEADTTAIQEIKFLGYEAVVVSNAKQLVNALADDTVIALKPGKYDLTDLVHEFKNYMNMRLVSLDAENKSEIIITNPYESVLTLDGCSSMGLVNLVMGHEIEQGECSGHVLALYNVDGTYMYGCDLYGCGALGIDAYQSYNVTVYNSKIHDCTEGIAAVNDGIVSIHASEMVDCAYSFMAYNGYINIYDSNIARIANPTLFLDDMASIYFGNTQMDEEMLTAVKTYYGAGNVGADFFQDENMN